MNPSTSCAAGSWEAETSPRSAPVKSKKKRVLGALLVAGRALALQQVQMHRTLGPEREKMVGGGRTLLVSRHETRTANTS